MVYLLGSSKNDDCFLGDVPVLGDISDDCVDSVSIGGLFCLLVQAPMSSRATKKKSTFVFAVRMALANEVT